MDKIKTTNKYKLFLISIYEEYMIHKYVEK